MDNLPDHLIIDILSRLNDSFELARCKLVSKTFNTLAREVRSIHLYCSLERCTRMLWPETMSKVTPLKRIFYKLISDAKVPIESVSLGVDNSVHRSLQYNYNFERWRHHLFLTGGLFGEEWMVKIGHGLKSISIEDFSIESLYVDIVILQALSYNCHNLVELTLKNTSLCADDIRLMPLLTRLTLNCVKLSDEILNKLMECLPCLQVLNLIDSGVGPDPKIHHSNLQELNWSLYYFCNTNISSLTIFAPNLTKLEFQCNYQTRLSIHAPLLSYCNLDIWRVDSFEAEKFKTLKTLCLASWDLHDILSTFSSCVTVQNLTFGSIEGECYPEEQPEKIEFSDVFAIFPNVASFTLGYKVWSQLMIYPSLNSEAKGLKDLKQFTVYLAKGDINKALSFILYVVGICTNLSDIVLLIHHKVDLGVAISFVSSCMSQCLKVRFRLGTWRDETKDGRMILGDVLGRRN